MKKSPTKTKVSKTRKGVRMPVTKKRVIKRAVDPLIPLCNALTVALDKKLKGKNSWGMSATLIGAKTALRDLVEAIYTK